MGGANMGLSESILCVAARSLTPIPAARSLAQKGWGTLRPDWVAGGRLMKRDRNAGPRRLTTTLTNVESLEPRAMLAGVGPETWSSPGPATAPQGTGGLSPSGTILTCSSPTPGLSGTASPPAAAAGSADSPSGGGLWLPITAGAGAVYGSTGTGATGGGVTNGPALSSQFPAGGSGTQCTGTTKGATPSSNALWLASTSGSDTAPSGSTGNVNTYGPALSSQYIGGSNSSGQGDGTNQSGTLSGSDLWFLYGSGLATGTSSSDNTDDSSADLLMLLSQHWGGSNADGQGHEASEPKKDADLWTYYGRGTGAGSADDSLAYDPTTSVLYTGGSGGGQASVVAMFGAGGMVFFVTGDAGSDATQPGSKQGQNGATTPPSSAGPAIGVITPLVYQFGSDEGPGFHSGVWTGDDSEVQLVQMADQQGNPPVTAAPETPSNWTRLGGVFDVIGGLGEAAVGGTGVVASGVGTVFSGGSAAPVSIPLLVGSSVLTLHGIDQAWAGIATVYWGTRQRPIAAQGLDRVTGNETASDVLNGVAGAAVTGGVGLAVKGAGLGTRALSSSDDVGRAVGTTLDDGAKAAGTAARGAGDEAVEAGVTVPAPATSSPRVNKVQPTEGAGPHTAFKRDPKTGEITGYTVFDEEGNPVLRFRADGKPHGGVEPPIIYEPKPGKGPGSPLNRARPANPDEIPGGS